MAKKAITGGDSPEEQQALPLLDDGQVVRIVKLATKEKKTKPPSLYTEGQILTEMEAAAKFVENDPELKAQLRAVEGIGTPATRPAIIEGLKHDGYLERKGKHIIATEKGTEFVRWLRQVYPEVVDVALTAKWEAKLSLIAEKGGGPAFEEEIRNSVKKLVTILKTAPSLKLGSATTSTTKETNSMSENRSSKPTDKMLEYAKNIAKKVGVRIPDDVMADYEACKKFIDENKDAANKPSDKQVNFAKVIAERKGVAIPDAVLANGKELSAWIDAHKD